MSVDAEVIRRGLYESEASGEPISDLTARVVASAWHGGQGSALYAFASTGAILRARTVDHEPEGYAPNMGYVVRDASGREIYRGPQWQAERHAGDGRDLFEEVRDLLAADTTLGEDATALGALYRYADERGERGPVEGWDALGW